MTLDHYIPRFLTRPWHDLRYGKTSLRVFDFRTNMISTHNSRRLFSRHGVNAQQTEQYLNANIETPLAAMQERIRAVAPDMGPMQQAFSSAPWSALVGLYWLQVQRILDAHQPRTKYHLDELARAGPERLEALSAVIAQRYHPYLYVIDTGLYFPETGYFLVPLVGQMPAIAMPFDTGIALVFVDKTVERAQLDRQMLTPGLPTALSLGLSQSVNRVILPPELEMTPSPETLTNVRARVRELFETYSKAGLAAGLDTVWRLDR